MHSCLTTKSHFYALLPDNKSMLVVKFSALSAHIRAPSCAPVGYGLVTLKLVSFVDASSVNGGFSLHPNKSMGHLRRQTYSVFNW